MASTEGLHCIRESSVTGIWFVKALTAMFRNNHVKIVTFDSPTTQLSRLSRSNSHLRVFFAPFVEACTPLPQRLGTLLKSLQLQFAKSTEIVHQKPRTTITSIDPSPVNSRLKATALHNWRYRRQYLWIRQWKVLDNTFLEFKSLKCLFVFRFH